MQATYRPRKIPSTCINNIKGVYVDTTSSQPHQSAAGVKLIILQKCRSWAQTNYSRGGGVPVEPSTLQLNKINFKGFKFIWIFFQHLLVVPGIRSVTGRRFLLLDRCLEFLPLWNRLTNSFCTLFIGVGRGGAKTRFLIIDSPVLSALTD